LIFWLLFYQEKSDNKSAFQNERSTRQNAPTANAKKEVAGNKSLLYVGEKSDKKNSAEGKQISAYSSITTVVSSFVGMTVH
jgi:hypothetical protein